ncbi:hypothetical protein [Leucobacter soli]|uniref:hypothetical protein n=1 Tax=Leucobacter soli TaxID=2812850 RepID=UPI0036060308
MTITATIPTMADKSPPGLAPSSKTRLGISAWAIMVFVFLLGANGVRNLVGLPTYFVLAGIVVVSSVWVFLVVRPERYRWYRIPAPLYWFLGWAALSIIWSAYRFESVLGVFAQLATTAVAISLAFVLTWHELLRTLATALRYLIGLSLLFELWVSSSSASRSCPGGSSSPRGRP